MPKITRVFQKLFGSTSSAGELRQFGSLAAGAPLTTTDPAVMQALGNFDSGWFAAVLGANSPAIEDMNTLFFLTFRQIAYMFQAGVPEYDSSTVYYKNSLCLGSTGVIYQSLVDDNQGESLNDNTKWKSFGSGNHVETINASSTLNSDNNVVLADASLGAITLSLPDAASSLGVIYKIKKIDTSTNKITIDPDGAELIEGLSDVKIETFLQSYTLVCDGTGWYLI